MKKIVFAILSFLTYTITLAQTISVEEYIATYKDIAILEMKRTGIPASVTLAQGLLETESGNSDLVKRSNNHFGIKCKNTWTGESVFHDDDSEGECFRKYDKAEDSYRDHSNFLRGSSRYAFLFELDPSDYKSWAYGLKKAGYATNPRYPEILIKNIEENNLHQYDEFTARENDRSVKVDEVIVDKVKPVIEEKKATGIVIGNEMNTAKNIESIKAGKTLFNGLKAVFVPKGTSLLAIATEFDISLVKLLEYNDLKTDGLLKYEQWIFLEKKLKQGNRDFYTAEQGETLYGIAQTNAIQLASLVQFNNLKEDEFIKRGTKIRLRPGNVKLESKSSNTSIITHQVQPKEGLYTISKIYHVPVDEIKQLNNLIVDDLKVGQQLIISK
jgi:LysM repeat protein